MPVIIIITMVIKLEYQIKGLKLNQYFIIILLIIINYFKLYFNFVIVKY
jgi:hypothetical protein